MIAQSFPRRGSVPLTAPQEREHTMESLTAGTFAGAGSFRCRQCGYSLTLEGNEVLGACPSCGGEEFTRASLFRTDRISRGAEEQPTYAALAQPAAADLGVRLQDARAALDEPGDYLLYEDEQGEVQTVALAREWTRIGRSLAADLRFDDPTVSRRHALIVHHADGIRLLDDRSLNGVFVNGERIDGRLLQDGDEIIVGRYRLSFAHVTAGSPVGS